MWDSFSVHCHNSCFQQREDVFTLQLTKLQEPRRRMMMFTSRRLNTRGKSSPRIDLFSTSKKTSSTRSNRTIPLHLTAIDSQADASPYAEDLTRHDQVPIAGISDAMRRRSTDHCTKVPLSSKAPFLAAERLYTVDALRVRLLCVSRVRRLFFFRCFLFRVPFPPIMSWIVVVYVN